MVNTVRKVCPNKPHFTIQTLASVLESEPLTVKLARDLPQERNTPTVKNASQVCLRPVDGGAALDSHLIYVDEMDYTFWTRRSPKGAHR